MSILCAYTMYIIDHMCMIYVIQQVIGEFEGN